MYRLASIRALLLATAMAVPAAQCLAQTAETTAPRTVRSSLPDLGSGANAVMSRADESQIGRQVMRELRAGNQLLDDPETADYLQAVGSRIGVEAQDGDYKLTFFAVRDTSVNAFALPGGFIGVNAGLILLSSNESELAGVLAHEVGHVVQRHIARAVQAQSRSNIAMIAGMLGAVLVGAVTGNADALPGIIALSQGTAMQQQINFTRMEEHEADRIGIEYLAAAGFDPNGMAGFFQAMMRERGVAGIDVPPLLLTHPVDTVRLAEARARIASMPAYERRPDSISYPFIHERVRVLTSANEYDLRRYYERARALDPDNRALRYGAALAELKAGNSRAAIQLLQSLTHELPELPLLHAALGQAQYAAERSADGAATFERALAVAPRNVPLSVRYAEALMNSGEAKKAHQLLLDVFNFVAPTPEQIWLIARAASAAGDTGDAYYYMAELHIANGDLMLATSQLEQALAVPKLTDVQRKRFAARRDEIRSFLSEEFGGRPSRPQPAG